MWKIAVISVVLGLSVIFSGASAQATSTTLVDRFLDGSDTLQLQSGSDSGSPGTIKFLPPSVCLRNPGDPPESCGFTSFFSSPVFSAAFDDRFNIYEPDGVTLSDTLEVTNVSGTTFFADEFSAFFQSDVENGRLVPLVGGKALIEDGTIQTAVDLSLAGIGDEQIQFQSDASEVPEPSSLLLFGTGILSLGPLIRLRIRTV